MTKKPIKLTRKNKNNRRIFLAVLSMFILVLFALFYIFGSVESGNNQKQNEKKPVKVNGNEFSIDGKLDFFTPQNDTIVSISIEIAEDDYSREKGLMFRYNIPDTVGMLFVFPEEDYHTFWMKNTPSSLDIIYADAMGKIKRIYEDTDPFSEESIPSGDMVQYVIEVKAGFCSIHHISTNDHVEFVRYK